MQVNASMPAAHSAEVVRSFVGYTTNGWALVLYQALVILTGVLFWVLSQYTLQAR